MRLRPSQSQPSCPSTEFDAIAKKIGTQRPEISLCIRSGRRFPDMRIAQIAPLVESVPPTLYGGTERVVSWLTEELVATGHEVTLFASGDSVTRARLEPVVPRALRLAGIHNSVPYHIIMLDRVAQMRAHFDVIHFHIDFFHYP